MVTILGYQLRINCQFEIFTEILFDRVSNNILLIQKNLMLSKITENAHAVLK